MLITVVQVERGWESIVICSCKNSYHVYKDRWTSFVSLFASVKVAKVYCSCTAQWLNSSETKCWRVRPLFSAGPHVRNFNHLLLQKYCLDGKTCYTMWYVLYSEISFSSHLNNKATSLLVMCDIWHISKYRDIKSNIVIWYRICISWFKLRYRF